MIKKLWKAFLRSHNRWISLTIGGEMLLLTGLLLWIFTNVKDLLIPSLVFVFFFFLCGLICFTLGIWFELVELKTERN